MSLQRTSVKLMAALTLLVAAGCQNSKAPAPQAMTPPQSAVVITGNGGSTVVYLPSSDPNAPMMLSTAGVAECPECRAAAIKYFQTGVLDPKCSRTGATRTATTLVAPTPTAGHN